MLDWQGLKGNICQEGEQYGGGKLEFPPRTSAYQFSSGRSLVAAIFVLSDQCYLLSFERGYSLRGKISVKLLIHLMDCLNLLFCSYTTWNYMDTFHP